MITRRSFLSLLAAPAIVRVATLMPVKTALWTPRALPFTMVLSNPISKDWVFVEFKRGEMCVVARLAGVTLIDNTTNEGSKIPWTWNAS